MKVPAGHDVEPPGNTVHILEPEGQAVVLRTKGAQFPPSFKQGLVLAAQSAYLEQSTLPGVGLGAWEHFDDPIGAYHPRGHFLQLVWPYRSWYVFSMHAVHCLAFTVLL